MYMILYMYHVYTVEPQNNGHVGTSYFAIIERLSSLPRSKMYAIVGKFIIGASKSALYGGVLCSTVHIISPTRCQVADSLKRTTR